MRIPPAAPAILAAIALKTGVASAAAPFLLPVALGAAGVFGVCKLVEKMSE